SRVVHLSTRRLILHNGRNLEAIAARARRLGQRLKDDLLALVRLALTIESGGVSVGDVASDDVHPQALGGERRARDAHAAEETHASVPAFPLVQRSVRQAARTALGMLVPNRQCEGTCLISRRLSAHSGTPTASSRPSFLIAGLVTVNRMMPAAGALTSIRCLPSRSTSSPSDSPSATESPGCTRHRKMPSCSERSHSLRAIIPGGEIGRASCRERV